MSHCWPDTPDWRHLCPVSCLLFHSSVVSFVIIIIIIIIVIVVIILLLLLLLFFNYDSILL